MALGLRQAALTARFMVPAVLVSSCFATTAHAAARSGSLRFVDDRGNAVVEKVEVCFQVETRNVCDSVRGGAIEAPLDFVSVRVEGPDHGPVTAPRQSLERAANGDLLIALPRKARLQIVGGAEERLTLSLYPQGDATFRSASFRSEVRGASTVKVPAGEHLVSLAGSGRAPDLHLLSAEPGGNGRIVYRPRLGWSLVVRCRSETDGAPVQGAQISLRAMEGFSARNRTDRQTSGKSGLAVFSGIPHLLASAQVDHPRFVPHREEGISASPATFAFRDSLLEVGGTLHVEVTADGKPLPGADCQVLEYEPNPRGPAPEPKVRSQARTDNSGTCRSGRLPPGPYTLRLAMPGERSFLDRSVVITNGNETALTVPMIAIRVHGTVFRGNDPASGYLASFSDQNELKENATRRDAQAEATTDEEGEYQTVLWSPGDYFAMLETPQGTPAGMRRVRLESAEERVDFYLEGQDVAGTVVDERDRPIADASVILSWNRYHRSAATDKNGLFSFPLTENGRGSVRAMKPGYSEPPPVEIEAQPGAYPPPLILRLKRRGILAGRLLGYAGPAVGAVLLAVGDRGELLGMASADPEGQFELPASAGAPTRVFATGAGCPLTTFALVPSEDELVLRCAEQPASLELRFTDTHGKPVPGKSVFARRDGVVIPEGVLSMHLSSLHLSAATDGGGRLLLVGLAPGNYDFYLSEATNPELISSGLPHGFLTTASLAPLTTSELEVTVEAVP